MPEPIELNRKVSDETFYESLRAFIISSAVVASNDLSTASFEPFAAGNRSFPCVDRGRSPGD
ncbi:hypothetical protein BRC86_04670 [Halobacteriales archaeon QS_3_64_16]|nr:MAG: hypothetical protein BRC86_04670 [Halobacteriales archaeon QS_3_64_16]